MSDICRSRVDMLAIAAHNRRLPRAVSDPRSSSSACFLRLVRQLTDYAPAAPKRSGSGSGTMPMHRGSGASAIAASNFRARAAGDDHFGAAVDQRGNPLDAAAVGRQALGDAVDHVLLLGSKLQPRLLQDLAERGRGLPTWSDGLPSVTKSARRAAIRSCGGRCPRRGRRRPAAAAARQRSNRCGGWR